MSKHEPDAQHDEQPEPELPPGVKLSRTIEDSYGVVTLCLAFSHDGQMLATGGDDNVVKVWHPDSGACVRFFREHHDVVESVAFSPDGLTLASGGNDRKVHLWDIAEDKLLDIFEGHTRIVFSVAFSPDGLTLASGSGDGTVKLWSADSRELLRMLDVGVAIYSVAFSPDGGMLALVGQDNRVAGWTVHDKGMRFMRSGSDGIVWAVAFHPSGGLMASGGDDRAVRLWDTESGRLLHILEGHTNNVDAIAFSADGRLMASKSHDGTIRLWSCETWETVAVIPHRTRPGWWGKSLAFHPTAPLIAAVGLHPNASGGGLSSSINFWELDLNVLLGEKAVPGPAAEAVHHTTAKIVLVGDSGVGKTGLGWRLTHPEYKEHSSTHGQQFWVMDELGARREDGTECEAILWDLAGQPDYRLTHALFLDDADLALILFDPTDSRDPLHGVEFWLKQLKTGRRKSGEGRDECAVILVGARSDRGEARLTQEELDAFCRQRGIDGGYLATSAKDGRGLEELLRRMKASIPWEEKAATVTTVTFKNIKDYVLNLKESSRQGELIVSPVELRGRLEATDAAWSFTDDEMMTAVGHLENYGYVRVLRTSKGGELILLAPELLNNLAASFVLEARRNPKGLGSLEERLLLAGDYKFRELEQLSAEEQGVLLDAAALLFLEHNVCFRETDLTGRSYLVFPELINLRKPLLDDEQPTEEGVAYTVAGAVENVYASLVVLLGYTQTFTRTNQWQNQARYVMGDGSICGFRQDGEREGELEFVLYFGVKVPRSGRKIFEGLFENFLARRSVTAFRYEPVFCPNGHTVNRAVVRERLRAGKGFAFCAECGEKVSLPKADEPVRLTKDERFSVEEQRRVAARRTRFEQAVFQVKSYVEGAKLPRPECFVSYAWDEGEQDRWVERNLARDLQKAGLNVVLDRWEMQVGASLTRFVERIEKCDRVLVIGTPLYRMKYENKDTRFGSVVAAEVDVISSRLLGTEEEKQTVLPVLRTGEPRSSLPPLLHNKVFADFRNERAYFTTAFDLILSLYKIAFTDTAVADLRESLRETDLP